MRSDLIAVSTREAAKLFTLPGEDKRFPNLAAAITAALKLQNTAADWRNKPKVSEIIAGKASGRAKNEKSLHAQSSRIGTAILSGGSGVYQLAKTRGLGKELPGEWFCQDEHW